MSKVASLRRTVKVRVEDGRGFPQKVPWIAELHITDIDPTVNTSIQPYAHASIHLSIHAYMTYTHIHTHTHIDTHLYLHFLLDVHIHVHTYATLTYIEAYIHTFMHIYVMPTYVRTC